MLLRNTTETTDIVRTYLREIGSTTLLTRAQEENFGRLVQQMMKIIQAKKKLVQQLHREPTDSEWAIQTEMTPSELNKVLLSGEWAKRQMVEANLRLVVAIAKQHQNRGLELLDLVQEGTLGLIRGVEKFDPEQGYRLSTYCWHWCRQAISRALADKSRQIRLPVNFCEKLNKLNNVQRQLLQKLGRTPTVAEVAAEMKLTPEQVRELWQRSRQPFSLDVRIGDNHDTSLGELVEVHSSNQTAFDYLLDCERRDCVQLLLAGLTPQQRLVLSLSFGLEDGVTRTLAEIGRELNITREGVRKIKLKALETLRQSESAGTAAELL